MDSVVLKSLVANAKTYLSESEFETFRKQVNEVYLQCELHALYQGMPLDKEPEVWRLNRIHTVNQQLLAL